MAAAVMWADFPLGADHWLLMFGRMVGTTKFTHEIQIKIAARKRTFGLRMRRDVVLAAFLGQAAYVFVASIARTNDLVWVRVFGNMGSPPSIAFRIEVKSTFRVWTYSDQMACRMIILLLFAHLANADKTAWMIAQDRIRINMASNVSSSTTIKFAVEIKLASRKGAGSDFVGVHVGFCPAVA